MPDYDRMTHRYVTEGDPLDIFAAPLSEEDFAALNLPPASIRRLRYLLEQRRRAALLPTEQMDLEGFRQAAFYLRMRRGH